MVRSICLGALLLQMAVASFSPLAAQAVREHEIGARAFAFHDKGTRRIRSFAPSADAEAVVASIIGSIGLPMNLDVRAAPDVANAEALVEKVDGREVRVILYNPAWMEGLRGTLSNRWTDASIMAHEIGHHLAGHLDPAYANHAAELEADYFSGHILNRLGATLEQAQLAIAMITPAGDTTTHPGRERRVQAVARGWQAASGGQGANVIKARLPVPTPAAAVPAASTGQRVALLIGNSNYQHLPKLKNPKNDVIAIQRELRKLGFSTTTLHDAGAAQIAEYVRLFREEAKDADWAVFYFAGTGVQVDGVNYMEPVDIRAEQVAHMARAFPQMGLPTVFDSIGAAKTVRLAVFDACRVDPANPPDASGKTVAHFKVLPPPHGIVVAYSTAAGQYAGDGDGDLSPYAAALIDALRTPGLELDKVFRRVNAQVHEKTKHLGALAQAPTVMGDWPAVDLYLQPR